MPKYVNCSLCGLNRTQIIQEAEEPFKVVKCRNCGLVYTNPQPERGLIEEHYQEEYYREWMEKQMEKRIPMWKKRLKEITQYKNKGHLLDVGCGIGTFLKLAKEEGFGISGTEISEYASRYVKENLRIDVLRGDIEELDFPPESFDVLTMWHTLEHLPNPKAALKEINRILKREGLLVIATPNLNNFITRVLYFLAKGKKLKLFSDRAKELHLYHFSIHTLASMLKETGFRIIKIDMDLAQLAFPKKILDYLTFIVHAITRKNFGEAIKIYAVKA
ncbi:MAG: methyltransferase domain-containing protein [Candidatus Aminicenantes bacterium]|nr:methyltransferase domain-containing protein [Candidatus Aminicenantes bacterium]